MKLFLPCTCRRTTEFWLHCSASQRLPCRFVLLNWLFQIFGAIYYYTEEHHKAAGYEFSIHEPWYIVLLLINPLVSIFFWQRIHWPILHLTIRLALVPSWISLSNPSLTPILTCKLVKNLFLHFTLTSYLSHISSNSINTPCPGCTRTFSFVNLLNLTNDTTKLEVQSNCVFAFTFLFVSKYVISYTW